MLTVFVLLGGRSEITLCENVLWDDVVCTLSPDVETWIPQPRFLEINTTYLLDP